MTNIRASLISLGRPNDFTSRHVSLKIRISTMLRTLSKIGRSYKKLFTPGPLSVTDQVRESMVMELGSREPEFVELIERVHSKVIEMAELDPEEYVCVLMQGSGTYGVESGLQTIIPEDARVLCLSNGAYGNRIIKMVEILGVDHQNIIGPEDEALDQDLILKTLEEYDPTHVTLVHCETSTGMINDAKEIGELLKSHNPETVFFVDGMSSFGGVDFNCADCHMDMMVTSVNKCIQGVPGFSLVVTRKELLENDYSRTLSLSIPGQYEGFKNNGQFRFTPAVEVLIALDTAIAELEKETIPGREARYLNNYLTLRKGIEDLGYTAYLSEDLSGHIINSFLFPENDKFDFEEFYEFLLEDGSYIYPGKVTNAEVFRIGTIGEIHQEDVERLLVRIEEYSKIIGVI